jgi:hypothetical protein
MHVTVLSGNYEDKAGNRIVAFLQDQPLTSKRDVAAQD